MKTRYISLIFTVLFYSTMAFSQGVKAVRPWLGISIDSGKKGVLVNMALPETPALAAGILPGDEVLSVDGKAVKTPKELIETIASKGVGFTVKVELQRGDKKLVKKITLVAKPDMLEIAKKKLINKPAPTFETRLIAGGEGKTYKFDGKSGRVTFIEFWATWCLPCIASHPKIIEFAKKHKGKIDVISISGEKPKVIKKYVKKLPENPIIFLKDEKDKLYNEYFASAIPMLILVDKKGIVRRLDVGAGSILTGFLKAAEELAD